jgi:hypothetical protein
MAKADLSKAFNNMRANISKHSPEILTGIGIIGLVTTSVLAVKATPKALKMIEEKKNEEHVDELTPAETVKVAWKPYIPAAITGVTSIACLIGASSVNVKRNAALAAAYKLSETALIEYRDKVVETIGEKKEQAVRDKVAQKQIDDTCPVEIHDVYHTGNGDSLCLDPLSKRLFTSDIEYIRRCENEINRQLIHDICGSASLNEFYDEMGLERTDVGDILGWSTDHLIKLDIRPGMTKDGKPCLVISHYNAPKYDY